MPFWHENGFIWELVVKVFICWSGGLSKAIARALRDWLPDVIQSVEPFFSDEDIAAGTVWFQEIDEKIKETYFGILCMTATNKRSHWMHYEAGGLRKGIGENRIVPLRIDIDSIDLEQPIASFQDTACDKEGVKRLLDSINDASAESKLTADRLKRAFEKHWPELENLVQRNKTEFEAEEEAEPERTANDKIDEMLALLRQISQRDDTTKRQNLFSRPDPESVDQFLNSITPYADRTRDERFALQGWQLALAEALRGRGAHEIDPATEPASKAEDPKED